AVTGVQTCALPIYTEPYRVCETPIHRRRQLGVGFRRARRVQEGCNQNSHHDHIHAAAYIEKEPPLAGNARGLRPGRMRRPAAATSDRYGKKRERADAYRTR